MRTLAVIALLGLLAPVSRADAACGAAGYDGVRAACCCDDGDGARATRHAQIERACCCEIERPGPESEAPPNAAVMGSSGGVAIDAAALEWSPTWLAPPSRVIVPRAPARGPPAGGRTLLSLKTSLIC